MLRLRRKAASFSNSNIKWPARFRGMLPHRGMADLAAIPLLIARRGAHFSVKQRRPSLHAARGTDDDDSSGTGGRRGAPIIARRAALSKRQGRVVTGE